MIPRRSVGAGRLTVGQHGVSKGLPARAVHPESKVVSARRIQTVGHPGGRDRDHQFIFELSRLDPREGERPRRRTAPSDGPATGIERVLLDVQRDPLRVHRDVLLEQLHDGVVEDRRT